MKRQVWVYFSMVRRSALWASEVRASASSRNIILKSASPSGDVRAKFFILVRTTSMPLSSLALSSMKLLVQVSPNSSLAMEMAEAVFPTPGGPENIRWGRLPDFTYDRRRFMTSSCPTTSFRLKGRYFSIQISSFIVTTSLSVGCIWALMGIRFIKIVDLNVFGHKFLQGNMKTRNCSLTLTVT